MRTPTPTWDAAVLDTHRLVARVQKCRLYQFADPFDNYNSAAEMYQTVSGTILYSSAYRRFAPPAGLPGQGIRTTAGQNNYLGRNLSSNQATLIVKLAINTASLPTTNDGGFIQLADVGNDQCTLCVTPAGGISLYKGRGASGVLQVQTAPGLISPNLWYGIETKITVNGSVGICSVWVNGFQVLAATGIATQNTANAYANQIFIGDMNNQFGNMMMDDFRVWDSTGSTQNSPLGTDSQLLTSLSIGPGAVTGWAANGAAANWECTDDNPPDGDTTFVSASAASTADAYTMANPGLTRPPAMVVARSMVRAASGSPTMEIGVSSSGSTAGGSTITPTSSYAFVDACIVLDPATGVAWTAAGANAAQHWKNELS
jgi:hypothetical protein